MKKTRDNEIVTSDNLNRQTVLTKKTERNSNFELLRILAMIMIVFHHYCVHGKIVLDDLSFANKIIYVFFSSYGKLGVVVFVMLSGYFSCKSKFNFKRLFLLLIEVVFYSFVWYIIACCIGEDTLSPKNILISISVFYTSKYWFFTCYFALSIISPLLNIIIRNISQKQHLIICLIGGLVYSFISSFKSDYLYRNELISFLYLYLVAAYIRLYAGKRSLRFDVICLATVSLLEWAIMIINHLAVVPIAFTPFSLQSTTTLFISIFLILICKKAKPRSFRIINYLAASTFGIYLIHESKYRSVLWVTIFQNATYAQGSFYFFAIHMLITVLIIFVVGTIIDIARRELLERPISKLYDIGYNKIITSKFVNKLKKLLDRVV